MKTRVLALGSFALSLLLPGCPLTDHYQLMSEEAAGADAGMHNRGGAHSGGGPALQAGSGGTNAGADNAAAGEAGEVSVSGAPNGGALDAGGGATVAGGGALETGGGASGASGNTSCVLACPAKATCCASGCAELSMDPKNCGACGSACNAGRACASSACQGGWVPMMAPPPGFVARSRAAVVATGKSVFFWGGQDANGMVLNNGAIYYPSQDMWKVLPVDPFAPSGRMMASAVWTGSVVVVFGGTDATGKAFRDGAVYDPTGNQWTLLPANSAVSMRSAPFSFWDGTRAVFWGGLGSTGFGVAKADRFDLTAWSVSSNSGDPGALTYSTIGVDGATMYVLGGFLGSARQDVMYSYTSSTDAWVNLPKSGLSARSGGFGAWDGSHFVAWGGRDDNALCNDGSSLSGNKWTALGKVNAPSARMIAFRRSGWGFPIAPGVVAMIGGQISLTASATLTTDGAYYNVATSAWTPIPAWPSKEDHEYGMGAWTGEEFVLWGGRDNNDVTNTGERWAP
ncbi:MAG: hypothetical protein ABW061_18315 [Polyangiaceae bacterium]